MFTFKLFNIKFRLEFSFFFTVSILSLYREKITGLALLACLLHEAGHILAMKFRVSLVTFSASGIKITPKTGETKSLAKEIFILLAGPSVNFLLFLLFGEGEFGAINLVLMIYNLLPINSLDGGRILKAFAEYYFPDKAYYICRATGIFFALQSVPLLAVLGVNNISMIISAGFIIISAFYTT